MRRGAAPRSCRTFGTTYASTSRPVRRRSCPPPPPPSSAPSLVPPRSSSSSGLRSSGRPSTDAPFLPGHLMAGGCRSRISRPKTSSRSSPPLATCTTGPGCTGSATLSTAVCTFTASSRATMRTACTHASTSLTSRLDSRWRSSCRMAGWSCPTLVSPAMTTACGPFLPPTPSPRTSRQWWPASTGRGASAMETSS